LNFSFRFLLWNFIKFIYYPTLSVRATQTNFFCKYFEPQNAELAAVKRSPQPKDQRTTEEMRKLIER